MEPVQADAQVVDLFRPQCPCLVGHAEVGRDAAGEAGDLSVGSTACLPSVHHVTAATAVGPNAVERAVHELRPASSAQITRETTR
jgi:hypothetical protein